MPDTTTFDTEPKEWESPQAPLLDTTVFQILAEQASRTPHTIAVTFEGRSITYAELFARANQLARLLRTRGAQPDVLIGLCLDRSIEMVVGLLGILASGAAYVPLD